MNDTHERRAGVGSGTVSLLVIFTVLCLATLALLSMSTAVSSRRISQRGLQNTLSLSSVEGRAAEKLAELDTALLALAPLVQQEYFARAVEVAGLLGCEGDGTSKTVWFSLPVSETSTLFTKLILLPPGASARFRLIEQSTQISAEWAPEETGHLWLGDSA